MRRRRVFTAKRAFAAWALVVYFFLYLPITVVVLFAFNKPSATSIAAYHGKNICDIPPATGKPLASPVATFAAPRAVSSCSGLMS